MSARNRPNILVLFTDQQRYDALGTVQPWLQTPNMDRLSAGGVRFGRTYTNSPQCIPARASLALGTYPHHHGVWHNKVWTIPGNSDTWMRRLQGGGYRTAVFGKTHLFPHKGDLRRFQDLMKRIGFDESEEVAGPRAATVSKTVLTDLWNAAGVLDAYHEDMRDRYQNKPWLVRPTPLPLELYPDVYIARRSIDWLKGYDDTAPWMLFVGFTGPHEPWDTPEPYASRYRPQDMPEPVAFSEMPPAQPFVPKRRGGGSEYESRDEVAGRDDSEGGEGGGSDAGPSDTGAGGQGGLLAQASALAGRAGFKAKQRLGMAPNGVLYKRLAHRYPITPGEIAEMRANYAGHVTLIDDLVGDVLSAVEARGELDNTIVVLTSDHGEMNGDHGLIYKQNFLGPSVRVPLIVSAPAEVASVKQDRVAWSPVELMDVGPTLLDLAGLGEEGRFNYAKSLVPVMEHPRKMHRRAVVSEYGHEVMIATAEWKLAVNRNGRPYLLFDLDNDKEETSNLVASDKHAKKLEELQRQMLRHLVRAL